MNKLNSLKYNIYTILQIIFPRFLLNYLAQLNFLKPTRDFLFGRNDKSYFEGYIEWNELDFYLFASPQVLYKAKRKGIENSLTRIMLQIIDKNSNIIDIGANFGFITLVMAKYIDGKVFSFESEKNIFNNLKKSVKKNDLNNIKLFNYLMGEKDSKNTRTVDSLLSDLDVSINLIKIDTDGSDLNCLKGCARIISKDHPIIVIETNDNLELIIDYIEPYGYNFYYDQFLKEYLIKNLKTKDVPNLIASVRKLK